MTGDPVPSGRQNWQKAVLAADVPPGAKLLALMLSVYTDESGGQGVWFTVNDFGRLSGITSPGTIRRYLELLEQAGWFRSQTAAGGTVRFLGWPTPLPFGIFPDHATASPGTAAAGG